VLVIGTIWINRDEAPTRLATPTSDGITLPTDADGREIDVPPSQPATAMSFGPDGEILRPDPTRARVVDESGDEVVVPLAPNTTVDTVTGDIIPAPTGGSGGTTVTTGPTSSRPPGTTRPPSTSSPTTPPTSSPSTTRPSTTTSTSPSTTASTTPSTTTTTTQPDPPDDPGPAEP
jgi:hypothetical protein